MQQLYEPTALTPIRVAKEGGYIDWQSQPSTFKRYPEFLFRYSFDELESLELITLARSVTELQQIGSKPYYRLSTPSAGNLHPIELYIQVRGVKGMISGIYHVDVRESAFVLIQEIEGDGIETALGIYHRFEGILCLISMVPYRSEWKYGERAIRYCYLDAGHQLASIQAACRVYEQNCTVLSDFNRECLDFWMGFGTQEFSCMAIGIGKSGERSVKPMKKPLIEVPALDYIENNRSVDKHLSKIMYRNKVELPSPFLVDSATILKRRSARKFEPSPLSKTHSQFFIKRLGSLPDGIDPYLVVLRSDLLDEGIYASQECIREGSYEDSIAKIMVDQNFLTRAGVVMVLTSTVFSPETLMQSAAFVHHISLAAQKRGVGCTGIGAFYDKKLQQFLGTDNNILYVCALGEVA